jgi:glutamate-1-semialdehyde 2,1-aminomutase
MNPPKVLNRLLRLTKPGKSPLGVRYHSHNLPRRMKPKQVLCTYIELENSGSETWQLHHPAGHRVDLFVRWDQAAAATFLLPRAEVHPGERVTLRFALRAPASTGKHHLEVNLVKQNVAFFSECGSPALRRSIEVTTGTPTANSELYDFAARVNPWYYQPTRGVDGTTGGEPAFPLFVARASGHHIWDLMGRQYIDYVMGWGCALLGYAPIAVQRAIAAELDSAAVLPFPHPREMEVARMLTEDIPCAEMVIFGKNGSDVCTVAARLARVFTGRRTLLFCGYHGWQDWWIEQLGFAATGVPEHPKRLIHRFRFNDLADFRRLFEEHRADLAGVMLEPSGPVEGGQGPSLDADASFLATVRDHTREAGALLIYDEIMTGFRYPGGSVQAATGVVPDLACLGKALGGGLSLSALVGRARIMERSMGSTAYGPTFKGEVYPFAAARAAMEIYRREPVAEHVWRFGKRLQEGMIALAMDHGIAATMVGPPFRTALAFTEPDAELLRFKRTLYQQELLRAGINTYNGFMLPSYTHDDSALETTLAAVDRALGILAAAERANDFARYIEIPLL